MIAVSSHRPHAEDAEYRRTQILAKMAWEHVFDAIYYFGNEEPELAGPKIKFMASEPFPTIKRLCQYAGSLAEPVAIINADIVVTPKLKDVERKFRSGRYCCASSRRWAFEPQGHTLADMLKTAYLPDDRGRDIFCAIPSVWKVAANRIQPEYRIGHNAWDAWMTDFFRRWYDPRFLDFTALTAVFHPIHQGRNRPYAGTIPTTVSV